MRRERRDQSGTMSPLNRVAMPQQFEKNERFAPLFSL
jgi:hypothetical protein